MTPERTDLQIVKEALEQSKNILGNFRDCINDYEDEDKVTWDIAEEEVTQALAALNKVIERLESVERVVNAACVLVDADTYKHPVLSREDAVKVGADKLHDAVRSYKSKAALEAVKGEA
jgi:hypothetical protein